MTSLIASPCIIQLRKSILGGANDDRCILTALEAVQNVQFRVSDLVAKTEPSALPGCRLFIARQHASTRHQFDHHLLLLLLLFAISRGMIRESKLTQSAA